MLHRRTDNDQHHRHGGNARVQRADNEIRAENGRRPAWPHGYGEVPSHDGMHRKHHRDDGKGEDAHCRAQVNPLALGAAKAERQDAVEHFAPAGRAVARHGHVWDQRQVQIHGAGQQVGVDCQKIPHQWRMKVRPQVALVGIGEHPISQPDAPHVHEDAQPGLGQPKSGHQLRCAGERAAEFSFQHPQDG